MRKGSLLLIGNFPPQDSGTHGYFQEFSEQLIAKGWRVLCTSRQRGRISRLIDILSTCWRHRHDYDIVVMQTFSGLAFSLAEAVSLFLHLINKKIILSLHGGGLHEFAHRRPWRMRRLLLSAARVNTPSMMLKQSLSQYRGDIACIPNALLLDAYPWRAPRILKGPRLCWLRAFNDIYDPLLAVKAVNLLKRDCAKISLIMYGPDKRDGTLAAVRSFITDHNLENNVIIAGPVAKNQVPHVLTECDIFLNTTRYESFGIAVMEAAACGLPIVTTDVGELSYLWENDENALLVSEGDAEAIAAAVRRIVSEPKLAMSLSINARKKVEGFDWPHVLAEWENHLRMY